MIAQLQDISAREKYLVGVTMLTVIAALLYLLVLEPYYKKLNQLRVQVPAKQATYLWMQSAVVQITPEMMANKAKVVDSRTGEDLPLLTIVEKSAEMANFKKMIKRMQPNKDGGIKIWLADVYFDPWVRWVDELATQGIEMETVSVTRGKDALTDIQMQVKR